MLIVFHCAVTPDFCEENTMSLSLNCTLLCASGAAYDINPQDGKYHPDPIFSKAVQYQGDPIAISTMSDDSSCFPTKANAPGPKSDKFNACLVGQTSAEIIVSFRGTLPTSADDWFQDLLAEPVASKGLPGKVHCGFQVAVQSMIDKVAAAVNHFRSIKELPVYVTGHSKGGGMAPLAAYLLKETYDIPIQQVVTFAAPKSGNSAFATAYQSAITHHIRYENYGDVVPFLAPEGDAIQALADLVYYIPGIGPKLAKLIRMAAGWDYTPVGAELYIDSKHNICTHESATAQFIDLVSYYWDNSGSLNAWETAVYNAHTLACKYGYMSGTCPSTVCTATSPAEPEVVAAPEKVSV